MAATQTPGDSPATSPSPDVEITEIYSQPSWSIRSDQVELAVTRQGAQMAPVTFHCAGGQSVQPYYISPWQGEGLAMPAPILEPLRGDFFCMPFGGNGTPFRGENHPPHGETSGEPWSLVDAQRRAGVTTLTVACEPRVRPGRVTRDFSLADGQTVLYLNTRIEGCAGPMPLGHHATLAMPQKENSMLVSTSPFKLGMVCPHVFSDPVERNYQSLAPGAVFDDLARVPTIFKDPAFADCSAFPTRTGYCDLIALFEDPAGAADQPAWVTAVNTEENWLWFALKDPRTLPERLFWIDNCGRHSYPWNSRNRCLGLEDVCSYFDKGVAESAADNVISRQGIRTCHELKEGSPLEIRTIQGVAKVPAGFGRVAAAEFTPEAVIFISATGQRVTAAVRPGFLGDGRL